MSSRCTTNIRNGTRIGSTCGTLQRSGAYVRRAGVDEGLVESRRKPEQGSTLNADIP